MFLMSAMLTDTMPPESCKSGLHPRLRPSRMQSAPTMFLCAAVHATHDDYCCGGSRRRRGEISNPKRRCKIPHKPSGATSVMIMAIAPNEIIDHGPKADK